MSGRGIDASSYHTQDSPWSCQGSKRPGYKGSSGLQRMVTLLCAKPCCHCMGRWHCHPGSALLLYSLGQGGMQEQHPGHPAGSWPCKIHINRTKRGISNLVPSGDMTMSPTTSLLAAAWAWSSSCRSCTLLVASKHPDPAWFLEVLKVISAPECASGVSRYLLPSLESFLAIFYPVSLDTSMHSNPETARETCPQTGRRIIASQVLPPSAQ